jgi:hypothetical protein
MGDMSTAANLAPVLLPPTDYPPNSEEIIP